MLSYEEMPEDNDDLAKVQVFFPSLPDDTPESCPWPISEIMRYLAVEVPDGGRMTPGDLQFIRTAQVAECQFWIWRFLDLSGAESYVTVDRRPRRLVVCDV